MTFRTVAALLTLSAAGASLAACSTISGAIGESYQAALVGGQEVPGPGDPDGTGTVKVTADAATNTVCAEITVRDIATPTVAHIHSGARGVAGPPIVTLKTPVGGVSKECQQVEKSVAASIIANPAGFYVNVHTDDYPKGAIRGQLAAR